MSALLAHESGAGGCCCLHCKPPREEEGWPQWFCDLYRPSSGPPFQLAFESEENFLARRKIARA